MYDFFYANFSQTKDGFDETVSKYHIQQNF